MSTALIRFSVYNSVYIKGAAIDDDKMLSVKLDIRGDFFHISWCPGYFLVTETVLLHSCYCVSIEQEH